MANNLYDKAREAFLRGQINWLSDSIKVALIGKTTVAADSYVAKTSGPYSHQYLSQIPEHNILSTQSLVRVLNDAQNDAKDGVAGGSSVQFTNISGYITGIVIYKDTSIPSTSPLIAFMDDINSTTDLINNETVTIIWNSVDKIFRL